MISIGQTLHGYSEGHTLLASSERLPYEADSELFVLSDLSGQTFTRGFDGYLTGYPLPKINSFAFSRTWYAPEMDRPGCVWTHTLLIRNADLARLLSLDGLLELFQRPQSKSGPWSEYELRLQFAEESGSKRRISIDSDVSSQSAVCDALYATERPVIVLADQTDEFTNLFLKIWAQQWPGLRRRFTFCTGALEGRELNGRPFDLQCMPKQSQSLVAARIRDSILIDSMENESLLDPRILAMIVSDLELRRTQLREFARKYGADAPARRPTFASFARILGYINSAEHSADDFKSLIDLIAREFPRSEQSKKLKTDAFLEIDDNLALGMGLSRQVRLLSLCTGDEIASGISQAIEVSDLANRFLTSAPDDLMATIEGIIRANHINTFGQKFISQVSQIIRPEIFSEATSPALLFVLLGTNPSLVEAQQIWTLLRGRTHELIDSLAGANLSTEQWDRICRASIRLKSMEVASHIIRAAGSRMVLTALDCLDECDVFDPSYIQWFNECARHELEVSNWLGERESFGDIVKQGLASTMNPCSSFLTPKGLSPWMGLEEEDDARRLAFVIIIASYSNETSAPGVFSKSFSKLHRIAKYGILGHDAWYLLRSWLPSIGSYRDWDTCEKLRRALCRRFAEADWPVQVFLAGFTEADDLRDALDYITSERALREFGRRIVREVNVTEILPWQVNPMAELAKRLKRY